MDALSPAPTVQITLPMEQLADFCRRWKITRLEIFGSALRPDFSPTSDVDFLYTLAPDAHWGWEFTEAGAELAHLLGRAVDLVSRRAMERSRNPFRRQEILSTTRTVYVA